MRDACTMKEALDAGGYWRIDWYGPPPPYGSWGDGIWHGGLAYPQAETLDDIIALAALRAEYAGRDLALIRLPGERVVARPVLPGSRIGCEFVGEAIDLTLRAIELPGPRRPEPWEAA
jgi:hypothetical protein